MHVLADHSGPSSAVIALAPAVYLLVIRGFTRSVKPRMTNNK
jgi:hypothetical protein